MPGSLLGPVTNHVLVSSLPKDEFLERKDGARGGGGGRRREKKGSGRRRRVQGEEEEDIVIG